jgi:arylsulfatase A-like enzyme
MKRRDFLTLTAAASVGLRAAPQRPNIVFILADDLGYADLGCYGQRQIRTPNIDRLATQSMRFTDAYSGCTVCAPSRSVLMTGFHGGHTAIRSNGGATPILPEDVTVARILKNAGYATGGFGKWGLGDIGTAGVPWKHGFEEFFGYLSQVHAHYYYPHFLYDNDKEYPLTGNDNGRRGMYSHDVIGERAEAFIRKHKAGPFFCYMPFTLPHMELLVPEDSLDQYKGKFPETKPYVDRNKHFADQDYPRATYAGMVSRLDRSVGRVMALLKELSLEENTIVFFASDNGGAPALWGDDYFHSNGPLRGHKQDFYEGGIRVPMLARWPGKIAAGTVSHHPWSFCDVMPTLAEIAGTSAHTGIDGISVAPTLLGAKAAGRAQQRHEFMYWELPRYDARTGEPRNELPAAAVRMGDWKAVRPKPDARPELYNLNNDPGETHDLATESPEVMARIEQYLKTARTPPRRVSDERPAIDWWKREGHAS